MDNSTGIADAADFKRAMESSNVERVALPASGLVVRLCRPPVFAALRLGREGTALQAKITEARAGRDQAGRYRGIFRLACRGAFPAFCAAALCEPAGAG
jgi:hypothetical protein